MSITEETRLKKAHIALMRHPETALYSGVIMMGENKIVDDCPTACTNGFDTKYGREFVKSLTDEELRALVLHENLHIALKQISRFKNEYKDDPQLVNMSADYIVNDIIVNLNDKTHCRLPQGGLYDEKYHNWSLREVYNDLKQEREDNPTGFSAKSDGVLDEHDFDNAQEMTTQEVEQLSKDIDRALRQGGILAGKLGSKVPRNIEDLLIGKVDWRDVLREFINNQTRGSDEYTWRRYNKRLMANDIYLPSLMNETVGELVIAIDTSGSIGNRELSAFASELVSICDVSCPEKIRVLWWDTEVHGEQLFTAENYQQIDSLLKPQGGGGTNANCVAKYIAKQNIEAEAIIVFTDGYFDTPKWNISTPTLWLVTDTESHVPPNGQVVKQNLEEYA
jgi:predicted metal-dependent peptidase